MRVLIDADGCPVVRETVRQCAAFHVPCLLFCDTAHVFSIPGVEVFVADCGHDSTDYLLLSHLRPGDAIIMATDGLVNALGGEPAAEAWFQTLSTLSPAAFCTASLKEARSRNRAARPDDMSILCARIQKRSPLLDRAPALPDPIPDDPPAAQPDTAAGS